MEKKLSFSIQCRSFDVALHEATQKAADWMSDRDEVERKPLELRHSGTQVNIDTFRRGNDVTLHHFEIYE